MIRVDPQYLGQLLDGRFVVSLSMEEDRQVIASCGSIGRQFDYLLQ